MANRYGHRREDDSPPLRRDRDFGERGRWRDDFEPERPFGAQEWVDEHGIPADRSREREGFREPMEDFSERRVGPGGRGGWPEGFASRGYRGQPWGSGSGWTPEQEPGASGFRGARRPERSAGPSGHAYERWSGHGEFGRGQAEYGRGQSGWGEGEYGRGVEQSFELGRVAFGGRPREFGSGTGPFAGRGPKGYRRSDARIQEDISEQLTQHPDIDASDIELKVQDGQVTLTGTVDSRHAKRLIEDLVDMSSGVEDVHNQIRVKSRYDAGASPGEAVGRSSGTSGAAGGSGAADGHGKNRS